MVSQEKNNLEKKHSYTMDTDYLIIGGGIVGTSIAYMLSVFSPSKKTILVDKNTVGSATTGMSAGTLYCLGQRKSNTLKKRYSRFSLEDKAALVMETRSMIKTMEAKGYDCGYHETGALTLALNEEEKKYLESSYKLLQQNKYEVEWLPNIEAVVQCDPGMAGSKIAAAIHTPLSGFVDPMLLCHAFANAAQKKGVVLLENHDAQRIEKLRDFSKRRYGVSFNTGLTVCTDQVVLATGIFSWRNLFRPALVSKTYDRNEQDTFACKGQIWITQALEHSISKVLFFAGSALHWSTKPDGIPSQCTHTQYGKRQVQHAYGRPYESGKMLMGGDRIPTNKSDHELNEQALQENQQYVQKHIPAFRNTATWGTWTGLMPFNLRGSPFLGEINSTLLPGIWLATGFGAYGIMYGPGASKKLVQRIVS